jgi:hypothetical protein
MPVKFADDAARVALRRAIEAVERASAVEVVVAIRRQSSSWLHVNALVGAATTFAALAFMLLGSHPFSIPAIWRPALPRATDDINELPDALDHDLERRPRS